MTSRSGSNIAGNSHFQRSEEEIKGTKHKAVHKEEIRKRNGDANKIANPR